MAPRSLQERLEAALGALSYRERLNLLLRLGIPAEQLMGMERCTEHYGWRILQASEPLSFNGDTWWCMGCWRWFVKRRNVS